MRKIIITAIAVLAVFTFMGCGNSSSSQGYAPNQTAQAFGYTHGGYLGSAVVKTDADGKISVSLDEAFLPNVLGEVDLKDDMWNEGNTVSYVSHGHAVPVAKYVEYNGNVYVGTSIGSTMAYVQADENGAASGGSTLTLEILRDQGSMEAWYNNIFAGKFKVLPAFGGDAITVTTSTYGGLTKKNAPGYWGGADQATTWMSNIEAIQNFAEKDGTHFNQSSMVQAKEANKDGLKPWSVADAVTGATATDFKAYFLLIQGAVGQLQMQ